MSEAGLTRAAATAGSGVADTSLGAGFVTKQTPLSMRAKEVDRLPQGALGEPHREPVHAIQPEGQGPEVLMEPLRQHDPEERLRSIADAQAETEIAMARAHAVAVKNHSQAK